jgi:3-oxoacyl-[acyl-carrier-protein] synthase-3
MGVQRAAGVRVAGTGSFLPERVVTNEDLKRGGLDTEDDWVRSRTGIRERRFAGPHEATSDLALAASRRALEAAEVRPDELDMIICATMTPDYVIPGTAALVQRGLAATRAGGFDLNAACSGFVLALTTGAQFVKQGTARRVLVTGAEKMTMVIDPLKRDTAVIFADGAGAVVLVPDESGTSDFVASRAGLRGDDESLVIPAGGSRRPITPELMEQRLHYVQMKGRETYRFAVSTLADLLKGTCEDAGVAMSDVALVVPHQVNLRILESAAERANIPLSKMHINIDRVGNTSAASVAIALDEAARQGRLKRGDLVLMAAFGAGLAWASALIRW